MIDIDGGAPSSTEMIRFAPVNAWIASGCATVADKPIRRTEGAAYQPLHAQRQLIAALGSGSACTSSITIADNEPRTWLRRAKRSAPPNSPAWSATNAAAPVFAAPGDWRCIAVRVSIRIAMPSPSPAHQIACDIGGQRLQRAHIQRMQPSRVPPQLHQTGQEPGERLAAPVGAINRTLSPARAAPASRADAAAVSSPRGEPAQKRFR